MPTHVVLPHLRSSVRQYLSRFDLHNIIVRDVFVMTVNGACESFCCDESVDARRELRRLHAQWTKHSFTLVDQTDIDGIRRIFVDTSERSVSIMAHERT